MAEQIKTGCTHRTCICCEHLNFEPGSPGYSEYTPSADSKLECLRGVFYLTGRGDYDLQEVMRKAEGCQKFSHRTEAKS